MSAAGADSFERYGFDVLVRDLDPQGHVANHVYVAYLSEARARFMRALDAEGAGLLPSVVAEMRCRYVSPLLPFEHFEVGVRVAAVGRTSLRFAYRVLAGDRLVADGDSTEVLIQPGSKRPREIPPATRERLTTRVLAAHAPDSTPDPAGERTRYDGIAPRP